MTRKYYHLYNAMPVKGPDTPNTIDHGFALLYMMHHAASSMTMRAES
jgi:hypothetical protein